MFPFDSPHGDNVCTWRASIEPLYALVESVIAFFCSVICQCEELNDLMFLSCLREIIAFQPTQNISGSFYI